MDFLSQFQPYCLTVSDLTRHLRLLLESDELLQEVWVEGEISNLSRPSSGHIYFTLKDGTCALKCVIWRTTAQKLRVPLQEGGAVQLHGNVSLYEASGQYQLYVNQVRSAGEGALYLQFVRLKARLEAEGLFDPARKRPIPACPRRIGIVTSSTGAALQDMLNVLRRRYPLAEVILAATPVQGDDAPDMICGALGLINQLARPDVILLARGGGSLEDLWAFNDERVAYAIAASAAPVITGVGHETDFTIADFVADLRAPTPTAAAELATPNRDEMRGVLQERIWDLARAFQGCVEERRWDLSQAGSSLRMASPARQIREQLQRVDDLVHSAETAVLHAVRLERARLTGLQMHLQAINPLAILERGYAIVTRSTDGKILKSLAQVTPGAALTVRLADGSFAARVDGETGTEPHGKN